MRFQQRLVARRHEDGLVDCLIDAEIRGTVGLIIRAPQMPGHVTDGAQRLVAGILSGEFPGQPLERGEDMKDLCHLCGALAGNDRAAMGDELEQTLVGQHLERLAQGCAGDAELLGQQLFIDLFAGLQLALEDHLAQAVRDLYRERRAPDRVWGENGHGGLCGAIHRCGLPLQHFPTLCRRFLRYGVVCAPFHPRSGGGRRCRWR